MESEGKDADLRDYYLYNLSESDRTNVPSGYIDESGCDIRVVSKLHRDQPY